MKSMSELSLHFLQDVYDAEKRAVRSMQKIARAASNDTLKQAITAHRQQNEGQVSRLEQVFELVTGKRPRGKACAAMTGLVKEVDEAIEQGDKGPVLDAALIACVQAIEHYGMARYGALATWMRQAGKEDVAELLHTTLDEKKEYDLKLTELAEGEIHPEAADEEEKADEEAAEEPKPASAPRRGRAAAQKAEEKPAEKPARRSSAKASPKPEPKPEPEPETKPARKRGKQEAAPEPEAPAPKGRRGARK